MIKKAGLVTFRCAIVVIGTGDRDTAIISDAKDKLTEVLKNVPFLMVNLVGKPPLLVTAQKQKKVKRNKSHGKEH